jgi:hypothetical protein
VRIWVRWLLYAPDQTGRGQGYEIRQFPLRVVAPVLGLLLVGLSLTRGGVTSSSVANAQSSGFTCTEVIGFSQTDQ